MASTTGYGKKNQHSIPIDILDDLCSRFIINLPPEDRGNLVRICFQIELAHWFYLDYYCTDETTGLNPCGIREFAAHIFQHVPQLREHVSSLDEVLDNWREYKQTVPTYGAILLDTDLTHVLLVQSYWTRASWGFPKGKVNEDEEPWKCAAREVLEETGFDISNLINKNDYIETIIHEQICRLYIIDGIPRETKFQPRTRNEIKACEWFPLADLPVNKKDMTSKLKLGVSPNAFFMVLPFVKRMRRWVAERNSKVFTNTRRTRHKSMGDVDSSSTNKPKAISQGLQNEIQEYQQLNCNPVAKPYKNNTGNSHGNAHINMQGNVHVNNQGIGNIQANSQGFANFPTNNQGNANIQANSQGFANIQANSQGFANIQGNSQGFANIQANNQGNIHTNNQGIANIHANNQGITNIHGNSQGFANIQTNNQGIANIHTNNQGLANMQTNNQGIANIHAHSLGSSSNSHSTSNSHSKSHGKSNAKNTPNSSSSKKERKDAKRQLFTPQNTQPDPNNSFSPVQKEASPKKEPSDNYVFFNFVAPSWADFKFDRRAILDCFT